MISGTRVIVRHVCALKQGAGDPRLACGRFRMRVSCGDGGQTISLKYGFNGRQPGRTDFHKNHRHRLGPQKLKNRPNPATRILDGFF
jgi:hypothetical protein